MHSEGFLKKQALAVKRIQGLARKGFSIPYISLVLGLSEMTIRKIAKRNSISIPRQKKKKYAKIHRADFQARALELRRAGHTLSQIQSSLKMRRADLVGLFRKNGLAGWHTRKLTDAEKNEIVEWNKSGRSLLELAKTKDNGSVFYSRAIRLKIWKFGDAAHPGFSRCSFHKALHPTEEMVKNKGEKRGHGSICKERQRELNKIYAERRKLSNKVIS